MFCGQKNFVVKVYYNNNSIWLLVIEYKCIKNCLLLKKILDIKSRVKKNLILKIYKRLIIY